MPSKARHLIGYVYHDPVRAVIADARREARGRLHPAIEQAAKEVAAGRGAWPADERHQDHPLRRAAYYSMASALADDLQNGHAATLAWVARVWRAEAQRVMEERARLSERRIRESARAQHG